MLNGVERTEGSEERHRPMQRGEVSTAHHPWSFQGDWTTNHRVHMEGSMALAAYVAEDGLVGHQWEERPSDLRVFDAPV